MFGRFNEKVQDMFRRVQPKADQIFQSGRKIVGQISCGAGILGDVLGKVARVGGSVLNDSTVKELAGSNPTLQRGYDLAHRGAQFAGVGANLSNQISHLSNEGSYNSGNHIDNIKDAIQRGKQIRNDAQLIQYV
jgi:hypothetical protein